MNSEGMLRQSPRVTASQLRCRNQMCAYILCVRGVTLYQQAMLLHFTHVHSRLGTHMF